MSIDLHSHSTASDGSFPPADVAIAHSASGIKLAALTDHDTLGGVPEFSKACKEEKVIGIGGSEFSTVFDGYEVHLLGYNLDLDNPVCSDFFIKHHEYLRLRLEETLKKLDQLGYPADIDEVYRESMGNPPMPPHILKVLFSHGKINDIKHAVDFFWEYLSNKGKAFVPHETTLEAPVKMMKETGAVSIIAHPLRLNEPVKNTNEILDAGADGFELYYPGQDGDLFDELKLVADSRGCLVSGGSDYHGAFANVMTGEVKILPEYISDFLDAIHVDYGSLTNTVMEDGS
jgi:hypothetical protein